MTSASPVHRALTPKMSHAFHSATADGCKLLTKASLPLEVQTEAGAPAEIVVAVTVEGLAVDWEVVMVDKRPTRLAESVFFSFNPAPAAAEPSGWQLQVLGAQMSPTDTLGTPGASAVDSVYGGSPHLRGVEAARWEGSAGGFSLTSLDVPILCTGAASPFVTPRTAPPDMTLGMHWNIVQNIWNTKCARTKCSATLDLGATLLTGARFPAQLRPLVPVCRSGRAHPLAFPHAVRPAGTVSWDWRAILVPPSTPAPFQHV